MTHSPKTVEITFTKPVTARVAFIEADCQVRYWEDATVNGVEDTEGALIPCREGDCWKPTISMDGVILNWNPGTKASIHYKICDAGSYRLLDADKKVIFEKKDCYVPSFLCPKENGHGDYVIMEVDENGKIDGFSPDFEDFLVSEED